jgi:hypothetical protein
MFAQIEFPNCIIYDPCCGAGAMLDGARRAGYATMGSDLVRRGAQHPFAIGNILQVREVPVPEGKSLAIACNPPYGYEDKICERIIRHAIALPNVEKAVFVVPLAFLSSQDRWEFFSRECRPYAVHICSERPTMPPGAMIEAMGDAAYKGAMQDYAWLEYRRGHKGPTETKWMRPRGVA